MPVIIDEVIADVPAAPVQPAASIPATQQPMPPVAQDMMRLIEKQQQRQKRLLVD
ncbi:MAG: hypothetical protein VW258_03540 [Thalassolituus sp.]